MSFLPKKIYKICLESVPIVSADVLLFNHSLDKILLFKRNNKPLKGVFYTLGGRILKNENAIDTATRKLEEEANIKIANKNGLFLGGITEECFKGSIYENVDTHNINIFFGYIMKNSVKIKFDKQHSQYQWFSINSHQLHPHISHKINMIQKNDYFLYRCEIINVSE